MRAADLRTCEGGGWWHDGSEERAAAAAGRPVRPCPTCAADERAVAAYLAGKEDGRREAADAAAVAGVEHSDPLVERFGYNGEDA